jgi:hypothetical protein
MERADAMQRMAETLLRATGGRTVKLRLPAPAVAGDAGEELGLATPGFQDTVLWPVVFRRVWAQTPAGQAARTELLVSARAVEVLVGSLGYSAASVLFGGAAGVLVDDVLLEIEEMTAAGAMGAVYCYRLLLREPLAQLV